MISDRGTDPFSCADLEDNMDIRRLDEVNDSAVARFRKYLAA